MKIEMTPVGGLRPYTRNARTHSRKQIKQIAESIRRFGFNNPVLVGDDWEIIAGHGRAEAAKVLGMPEIPTVRLSHLSPADRRAYIIADNKLAEKAGWDREILAIELQSLIELDVDVTITGFDMGEIDLILDEAGEQLPAISGDDETPEVATEPVSRLGDVWQLGRHKLICGDALDLDTYGRLLGKEKAEFVFTDPPYNVPINGHVSGLGRVRHREFTMASGEMSEVAFTTFLRKTFRNLAAFTTDGSIHDICMDWRHVLEILHAGHDVYSELKNVCVWNKTNAGMGTFYRSKHEFVFVFKNGTSEHINNFELGQFGRYRSNVWDYAGVNTFRPDRNDELAMHPTVKPVALVADAIKDCSRRNGLVLDPFAGSGTILVAAERTGRRARAIELDPLYVDVGIRRWQVLTRQDAILLGSGATFEDVRSDRSPTPIDKAA